MATLETAGLTNIDRQPRRGNAMPFVIKKTGDQYCVHTKGEDGRPQGDAHGCHPTEAQAQAQMRALYANVPEARKDDDGLLTYPGSAVKALGDGRVGGHLVRFGGPEHADSEGEWFPRDCDFATDFPATTGVYYHHGLSKRLGARRLTAGKMTATEEGVYIEATLDVSDPEQARIYREAVAGRLGWSSGTAAHLTDPPRHRAGGAIKRWPLGVDASLTPIPADRRNHVLALKSWAAEFPDEDLTAAEHAAQVVTTNADYAERLESRLEARIKAGRMLSLANRQELEGVLGSLEPVLERIRSVLARAAPAGSEAELAETETPAPGTSAAATPSPEQQAAPQADLLTPDVYQSLVRETLASTGWLEGQTL
jgi:hypothetical protein